jgi:hypothetical protein
MRSLWGGIPIAFRARAADDFVGLSTRSYAAGRRSAMLVFRIVIRSWTGWSIRDQNRVLTRAGALRDPPGQLTERGFELSVEAKTADAARDKVEAAVNGIHSHTGVYLAAEIGP